MHTKLPEFMRGMEAAAAKSGKEKTVTIRGLENVRSCNMQSLRTGRIEQAVEELAESEGTEEIEVVLMPRVPETMHTVVVKAKDKDGKAGKAILEVINILHPTEEVELADCREVEDRRPPLGKH
ncbi:MAG: hypothetical protein ACOC29_01855 [Candidatus Sumerlaeota bacterium]